ncbi:hypothetical protein AAFC00_002498 [Neodothiora populina]|uniref:rRNA-processing protein EFG1 n=1 Tax=Neodothiora populina TaxID=2781224 RepID=A0ABR3P794_9PEZI
MAGTKRTHNDIHPSRKPQVPEGSSSKKRKTNPHPSRRLEPSNHAINPLKSRIRSLQRLLSHKDEKLPADVRLNHERELASCRYELEEAETEKRKSEMIGRYHMVRFFDRQKATRKLKQCKRGLKEAGEEDRKVWEARVHDAEVDVNYTQFYPLDQPYSALYPTGTKKGGKKAAAAAGAAADDDTAAEKVEERQGDPDMWKVVEICMAQGKLDKLRNGKLMKAASGPKKTDDDIAAREKLQDTKTKDKKNAKADKNSKGGKTKVKEVVEPVDAGEESDGGFFE